MAKTTKKTTKKKSVKKVPIKKGITKTELNLRIAQEENIKTEFYKSDLEAKYHLVLEQLDKNDQYWNKLLFTVGVFAMMASLSFIAIVAIIAFKFS